MDHPQKMNITLQIGEHNMRFPIDWDEEKFYRDAATLLKQRFQFYSQGMKNKSAEQIWVYVALEVAMNLQRENAKYAIEPVEKKIKSLNQSIIDTLGQPTPDEQQNNT